MCRGRGQVSRVLMRASKRGRGVLGKRDMAWAAVVDVESADRPVHTPWMYTTTPYEVIAPFGNHMYLVLQNHISTPSQKAD